MVFLIVLAILVLIGFFVVTAFLKKVAKSKRLLASGKPEVATVVSITQTGMVVNQRPQMRLTLDIQQAGEAARRITHIEIMDLGSIPRAGDLVYVLVDPADPNNFAIAGAPPPALQPKHAAPSVLDAPFTPQQTLDTLGLSATLRERGVLRIATILDIAPTTTQATRFDLEIDQINVPRHRVTITQIMYGDEYQVGDRIYLLADPDNPDTIAIVPLSLGNGQRIPRNANRLDALVLGPQLLREGVKATGTILEAHQISMSTPAFIAQGFTRWHLKVHITPADGTPPFDSEQDLSFTTKEKAERIARVGAEVPIRYDANDPHCFVTDSIAMGYPDPYVDAINVMKQALSQPVASK